jgi:hypothetical protein
MTLFTSDETASITGKLLVCSRKQQWMVQSDILPQNNQRCIQVVSIPASHLGSSGFKSQPDYQLSQMRFVMVFL